MSFIINAIKIIFILGFLVLIHEGGHFIVARLCKVKVKEFAIGFGPTIWQKQGKETKYALRLIPLGGFVNMEGEEERSDVEGSFSNSSIPKRMAIIVAGGLTNILFALIAYIILVTAITGDIKSAFLNTGNFIGSIVESLRLLFTGGVSVDQLMGPVGISDMVAQTQGIVEFLYIMIVISMSLGVTNLLPFPPLDGGKFVLLLIEAIRKKPLKEKTEVQIQMLGFLILISLSIYVTFNDVGRIIN